MGARWCRLLEVAIIWPNPMYHVILALKKKYKLPETKSLHRPCGYHLWLYFLNDMHLDKILQPCFRLFEAVHHSHLRGVHWLCFVEKRTASFWFTLSSGIQKPHSQGSVSTPLKNISQNGNLPQIWMKIKKYLKPPFHTITRIPVLHYSAFLGKQMPPKSSAFCAILQLLQASFLEGLAHPGQSTHQKVNLRAAREMVTTCFGGSLMSRPF